MIGRMLTSQLEYTAYSLEKNLEGTTHEESLVQPGKNGNCINWVVGHIVHHRNIMHRLVGLEPVWTAKTQERYVRGSNPVISDSGIETLSTLLTMYQASQAVLAARLCDVTSKELAQETNEDPLAMKLAGLVFHESYHVGQLGVIRRVLGKDAVLV